MQSLAAVLSRYWWAIALRGVLAILFGVMAFGWPGVTLAALILLFGCYALIEGVMGIVVGIASYGEQERWWATLLSGIVSIGAGLVAFFMPGVTALVLLTVIAVWAIVRGVFDIVAAIHLRKVITGEWLLALSGALSIGFGLLLMASPGIGALAVLWWIASYAVVLGVVLVVLGFRCRQLAAP